MIKLNVMNIAFARFQLQVRHIEGITNLLMLVCTETNMSVLVNKEEVERLYEIFLCLKPE